MAVDWVGNKIYWTDISLNTVEVAELDGSQRKILVANQRDHPQSIVVHPRRRLFFFSNGGLSPGINRAEMDGSALETIVSENVDLPEGLAIDYVRDRLYWADSKGRLIESSDLDGTNRVQVFSFPSDFGSPFSIDIFEDWIYGLTTSPYSVFRIDKFGNQSKPMGQLTRLSGQRDMTMSRSIRIVHPLKKDTSIANPCFYYPCEDYQLCLLSSSDPTGRKCQCQDGYSFHNSLGGPQCIANPSPCSNHNCANNGTCIEIRGRPKCRCPIQYSGESCQYNRCTTRCQNNGTCSYDKVTHAFSCRCTPKWKGYFCTENRCRNYCSGNGECFEDGNRLACRCFPPWRGDHCELHGCHDYCLNGGACSQDDQGSPQCLCPREFPGTRCEGGQSVCDIHCTPGNKCIQKGTTVQCICSSLRYTGEKCDIDRCDECEQLQQNCSVTTDGVKCIDDKGQPVQQVQAPRVALVAVIPILIILMILVILVLLYLRRKHRAASGFSHTRIENEDDMEFGNPAFKYSRQLNEDDDEQMDTPFTIQEQKVRNPTNFSNPIYSSLFDRHASDLSLEERGRFPEQDTDKLLMDDDDDD